MCVEGNTCEALEVNKEMRAEIVKGLVLKHTEMAQDDNYPVIGMKT
jgi:hypothetical protein